VYGLSDEDLAIQTRAREFADELIPFEVTAEMDDGELPPDVTAGHAKRARELGLHSTNMPRELGGGGCSMLQVVLVQEQMGRVTNALGWVAATPPSWLPPIATPYQIEQFVRPAVAGQREECYAITEEGAGSDVAGLQATARRVKGDGEEGMGRRAGGGDDYLLNGVKWHVTSYNTADFAFFQGVLADGPNAGEHAMFLVDLPSPGVTVLRNPAYSHTISHHHPIVEFADVRVPASHLIGAEGDGMTFAYEWFRFERLMVAARCLGAADRLTAEMTRFANERQVSGRPISEFGTVAAMLADSLTELFAARSLVYETARGIDRGNDVKIAHAQCSMAKLYASEMAGRVADRAVQVFAGRGYMRENVAERFYRELRVERIWEGTSEVQRAIIAAQMAKRGPAALA
jgi:alkylation response protein AidB-like acyl-CoA dehydrogenase